VADGPVDDVDLATLTVSVRVPTEKKSSPIPTDAYDYFHDGCFYWLDHTTGAPTVGCFTPGLNPWSAFPYQTVPVPTTHVAGLLQAQFVPTSTTLCSAGPPALYSSPWGFN